MMAWRSLTGSDPASSSMSQGVLGFSHGFRISAQAKESPRQQHIAHQSRRDKLRMQTFEPTGAHLVPLDEGDEPIHEPATTCNMPSDMLDFPVARGPSTTDLLTSQILGDWYRSDRQEALVGSHLEPLRDITKLQGCSPPQHGQLPELTVDSGTAMQPFLGNSTHLQLRSPCLPSPPPPSLYQRYDSFQSPSFGNNSVTAALVRDQGLSLSLSPSLHQLEMVKGPELNLMEGWLCHGNQYHQQQEQPWQLQGHSGQVIGQGEQVQHVDYGGSVGVINMLRRSRYSGAARELLEEFCSVGRDQVKGGSKGQHHGSSTDRNPSFFGTRDASTSTIGFPSSTKVPPPLSPAEKFEHQRRKTKLLSLCDEVDRRYNHYCGKMQMMVNSFESAMGFGAAAPYTALAQKSMSCHFRCLKDAIVAQLQQTYQLLGEDWWSPLGLTKGETPRLKLLDQTLRQQRMFHQMGMAEHESWRPQRGLPERSVNILRAWLFEHFLHPYPSDADKHFLARQTGLSRNQVSNWFINARVRLWKPMVEEMYQQEAKEAAEAGDSADRRAQSPTQQQQQQQQPDQLQISETHAAESNPSQNPPSFSVNKPEQQQRLANLEGTPTMSSVGAINSSCSGNVAALVGKEVLSTSDLWVHDRYVAPAGKNRGGIMDEYSTAAMAGSVVTLGRAGTSRDVSLTLGLRHSENYPGTDRFTAGDFGDLH